MTTAIVSAMPEELHAFQENMAIKEVHQFARRDYYLGSISNEDVVFVIARIGKVAAATTVATLINHFKIERLIFTGVAGSACDSVNIGDIVIADKLIQHDLDASPIFPKYQIPLLGASYLLSDPELNQQLTLAADQFITAHQTQLKEFGIKETKLHQGTIASGDQFIKGSAVASQLKQQIENLKCFEMEGAAVAQVCYEYDIPFSVIRTISDKADHKAPMDFGAFVKNIASKSSQGIIQRFLQLRSKPSRRYNH